MALEMAMEMALMIRQKGIFRVLIYFFAGVVDLSLGEDRH